MKMVGNKKKKASGVRYLILIMAYTILTTVPLSSQPIAELQVGDQMPDLPLPELTDYFGQEVSISSFRGKYILLDFWGTSCSVCIRAFPEMEVRQKEYGKNLQIILVNPHETREQVNHLIKNHSVYRNIYLPDLPVIYGDSSWRSRFPYQVIPHHVWIDTTGKIMAITGHYNANTQHIRALIRGNIPDMALKSPFTFDLHRSSLRSVTNNHLTTISKWSGFGPFFNGRGGTIYGASARKVINEKNGTVRYSYLNKTAPELLQEIAHMRREQSPSNSTLSDDTENHNLLWQVAHPDWFFRPKNDYQFDTWSGIAKFCYEIEMPVGRQNEIPYVMLNDLNTQFESRLGITAHFEKMPRKHYVLQLTDKNNLWEGKEKNAQANNTSFGDIEVLRYINAPFSEVFFRLSNLLNVSLEINQVRRTKPMAFINETGISKNIDIDIPFFTSHPDPVLAYSKFLHRYGLKITVEVRETDMLVIRDY